MADRYLLESSAVDGYLLEDGTGVLLLNAYSLTQAGFRFRNDNGTETTATWMAAENVDLSKTDTDLTFRIRFVIDETLLGAVSRVFKLQYRKNAGSWTIVDGASTNIRSIASANFADGAATTRQLTSGSGTFVAGSMDEVDGAVASITFGEDNLTEVEFCAQLRSADVAPGDTVDLRVVEYDGGVVVALAAYTHQPTISVGAVVQYYGSIATGGFFYFPGPVRSNAGNLYLGMRDGLETLGDDDIAVWKSTDGGGAWTKVGTITGHASVTGDARNLFATRSPFTNVLHFGWQAHDATPDQRIMYASWNMDTDTLDRASEIADAAGTDGINGAAQVGVAVRPNGEVVMTYGRQVVGSQETHVVYRSIAGTWQTPQLLDTTWTQPHASSLVMAANGDVHCFWHGWSSGGSGIKHAVLHADNSLSTVDTVTAVGTSQMNPGRSAINSARLFVLQVSATGDIIAWHSSGQGDVPTWTSTNFAQGGLDAPTTHRSYDITYDGEKVIASWILETDQSFNYRVWNEGTQSWETTVAPGDTGTVENGHAITQLVDGKLFLISELAVVNDTSAVIRYFTIAPVQVPPGQVDKNKNKGGKSRRRDIFFRDVARRQAGKVVRRHQRDRHAPLLTTAAVNALTGTSSLAFTVTSSLKVERRMQVAPSIQLSGTHTLKVERRLQATPTVVFSPVASAKITAQLKATPLINFAPSAILKTTTQIKGTPAIVMSVGPSLKITRNLTALTVPLPS